MYSIRHLPVVITKLNTLEFRRVFCPMADSSVGVASNCQDCKYCAYYAETEPFVKCTYADEHRRCGHCGQRLGIF